MESTAIAIDNEMALFTIDLVAGTIERFDGGPDTAFDNFFDFAYVIGNDTFEETNPEVIDPEFPTDFSLETVDTTDGLFTGLAFDAFDDGWVLDIDSDLEIGDPRTTAGFISGPVVTLIPEPGSGAMILIGAAATTGAFGRLRRQARVG